MYCPVALDFWPLECDLESNLFEVESILGSKPFLGKICIMTKFWSNVKSHRIFELHRCWWRMLKTKCVGDKSRPQYQELGTNCWWPTFFVTNIEKCHRIFRNVGPGNCIYMYWLTLASSLDWGSKNLNRINLISNHQRIVSNIHHNQLTSSKYIFRMF